MSAYQRGLDVLGDGIMDAIPLLSMFTKGTGSTATTAAPTAASAAAATPTATLQSAAASTQAAIRQALREERARQVEEKAATTRMVLFGVLGVVGIGGMLLVLRNNRR